MIENEIWHLLFVEDDEADYFLVHKMLAEAREGRFVLDWVRSYTQGIEVLRDHTFDAILVNYDMGGATGEQFIRDATAAGCPSPILVLTGRESYDIDLKAMQAGAADYLNKRELNPTFLERSIRYAVERKRSQNELAQSNAALHAAERRVRDILAGITDCYFLLDPSWQMVDINANALAFLKINVGDLLGKVIWESSPLFNSPYIVEKFRAVAVTGQPDHFEMYLDGIACWADVHAYPVEEGIAVYFADITGRKRTEQTTQFLASLGEKLIALDDPDAMIYSSMEAIVKFLNIDHCVIETVLPEQSTLSVLAEYHAHMPGQAWDQDRSSALSLSYHLRLVDGTMQVSDTATNPATSELYEPVFRPFDVGAFASIPRIVEGRCVNMLTVMSMVPRQWLEDEITLLRQVADLIWLAVENASLLQNLKATQARFSIALKNSEITVYTTDRELRYTWLYRPMPPYLTDEVIGQRDDELPVANKLGELIELKQYVLDHGVGIHKEVQLCIEGEVSYLDLTIEPSLGPSGIMMGTIVSCVNATRFHQMEEQVQTSITKIALQRQIMQSREEERMQISRDLHDGPIQNTIGLIFSLQQASMLAEETELRDLLKETQAEAQKLVGELRGFCNQLRPPILTQFGLSKAMRSYLDEFRGKHPQLVLEEKLCNDDLVLPDPARLALYRVFQESLMNIVRHSRATQVMVTYELVDQQAVLTVRDNGSGFSVPSDWTDLAGQGHLGLLGMKERTEALNGVFSIDSGDGFGTQIRAAIPYQVVISSVG